MKLAAEIAALAGYVLVVCGLGLIWHPLGVICAGLVLLLIAGATPRRAKAKREIGS